MSLPAYEKMGAFYLGKEFDVAADAVTDELLLYDAKDLTTHAVCVGMTGSGKTGLCLSLLEEAAIDGVPAIAIDPKGDLGNLMLTFPKLAAADFEPWVEAEQAARKGRTVPEQAQATAEQWRAGLADWQQDGARIQRFRDAVDVAIYTPGSDAGLPLTVLRSFAAPAPALLEDGDALRERIMASVSGLLALLGIEADPIRSREHILLSRILDTAWRAGEDLDIGAMILAIQKPGFDRIGVLDLESFYPAKDRFELALTLNNLLASPGFQAWTQGEPLDIQRLLWTPAGKPRLTILSIAHLSDSERMFFVTMLLNEVVSWMRSQPGSTSLRALLYMDEVFGYFPPTANPPSKLPMLTLMKQARAFGLGVVLATQNPVDLDYKGLSNAGTWFLGRLQTERDKARVLEGLEGASASAGSTFDRGRVEALLAGLKGRVFYMNNVHDDAPTVFHTRWALSYLRGPLTRAQIKTLMADRRALASPQAEKPAGTAKDARPVVPPAVVERFVPRARSGTGTLVYRPALLGRARVHYVQAARGVDAWRDVAVLAPLGSGTDRVPTDPWEDGARVFEGAGPQLEDQPDPGATWAKLPSAASQPKSFGTWGKSLASYIYREQPLPMFRCAALKAWSEPGEVEGDFRARLAQLAREQRDLEMAKLKQSYEPKIARLQERVRVADQRIEREQDQYAQARNSSWISAAGTILGALFGRKTITKGTLGKAGTTARSAGRASQQKADVDRAREDAKERREELSTLEAQFQRDLDTLQDSLDAGRHEIEPAPVRARKSDIAAEPVVLAWTPWLLDDAGIATPAF
ncbi:MAG: ATP-binding protein [Planctomycetota bacterium]|nr:ATP-binding protein [Planctomycetota bacterium]